MTMRSARLCVLLLVLFMLFSASAAMGRNDGFIFVVIADTQLGFTNKNEDMEPEIEHFTKAVEHINRLRPAFVIIAGDMINRARDIKQIRAFWRIAREIRADIPLYLVPGNHEMYSGSKSEVRSYEKLFGKDHYSFNYHGSAFIVLNSMLICSPNSDTGLRDAQRKWFEEELAEAKAGGAKHIFVVTHHPWFNQEPNEEDGYFNVPLTQRRDYLDLMKRYGVDYALAGHYHREALGHDDGLTMITNGALSKNLGNESERDPIGFRVFKVRGEKVEHTYYPVDNVPEQITP